MNQSPRMTIKGLIFDCDGTLADTMPLHWQAWRQVTSRHGVHFTEDRFYALGGVPSRHILAMLRDEQALGIDPLAVAKEKELAYLELMHQVGPIHEVVTIARAHHRKEQHLERCVGKLARDGNAGGTRADDAEVAFENCSVRQRSRVGVQRISPGG